METERLEFESWLASGFAAGMEYLKRNPHFRTSPQLLYPGARSAIIVAASYYTEPPPDPGPHYGRVARYAVGQDYHTVLTEKLSELKRKLEEACGRPLIGKAFTDDVALFEQAYARRSGLGFTGKNTMIIGPKLTGSYQFIAELFTDLALAPDEEYKGTCGQCFRCGEICPTDAIESAGVLNAGLCISYLTIENKGGVPLALREKIGNWLFGCDLCQEVCPYNQRPPITPWQEFRPESGAGHYLDLLSILKLKDKAEFVRRFQQTALTRPKLRGMQRNALVVAGNRRPPGMIPQLLEFALNQPDAMLREHAAWALSRYEEKESRRAVDKLYGNEPDELAREAMAQYICG